MRLAALQYDLFPELIARYPSPERDGARLLVLDDGAVDHRRVAELPELLPAGALLVVNDSRVIPARLLGRKDPSGGRVELLLVERQGEQAGRPGTTPAERWTALGRATGRLRPGLEVTIGRDLRARVVGRADGDGLLTVLLWSPTGRAASAVVDELGQLPLPPYLGRQEEPLDRDRYQTVFARVPGAVAAPTAGLHFSSRLLEGLAARGIRRTAITLHVGPGTFRPVSVEDLDAHRMHSERFVVGGEAVEAVAAARREDRPVVAVGTTVVRALETAFDADRPGHVRPVAGDTRLLIQPGYRFRVVDGLLTNFHLPGSTLLALVYAFGGTADVRAAYREAIAQRYRFYSYGDAMFLRRCQAPWVRPT